MKSYLYSIFICLLFGSVCTFFVSCAQTNSTLGNGKLDPVEAAIIQLAVGASMSSLPTTVVPAYGVTTALLAARDSGLPTTIGLDKLDSLIKKETAKLNLDPLTLQSCNELIALIKAHIDQRLSNIGIPESDRLVVVWQVIEIVNNTAKARLTLIK